MTTTLEAPATEALHKALATAQQSIVPPQKNKTVKVDTKKGGSYSFTYATFDAIIEAIRKPLADNGLSWGQSIEDGNMVTTVRHEAGGSIQSCVPMPTMPQDPQAAGSLITYFKRYGLCAALGIAADEDDDGNAAAGNHITGGNGSAAPGSSQGSAQTAEPKCPACGSELWHNPENIGQKKPVWKCKNKQCTGGGEKKDGGRWPWASFDANEFTKNEEAPQEHPPEPPTYGPKGTELKEYVTDTLGLAKSSEVAEWLKNFTGTEMTKEEAVGHFKNEALAATVLDEIQRVKSEKNLTDEQIKNGTPF